MRKPFIAGNWKMHKTIAESVATIEAIAALVAGVADREVLVVPVFTALSAVAGHAEGTGILVGAQDVAAEPGQGAYTGEVSAELLADAGATHCIVGHSERRQRYGDTDDVVHRKLQAAIGGGLVPILCVGE